MLNLFTSLSSLLKLDAVCIDNNVFRLHYKVTVIMLITFSLIVTSRQYVGDPIDCIIDQIPVNIMDNYCWIYSTFTLTNKMSGRIGKNILQPGVANEVEGDQVKYHQYYQWVCFALFFQAVLFYIPRYLWKMWENGRIRMIVLELSGSPLANGEEKKEIDAKREIVVQYFCKNLHKQESYVYRFIFCELLNLINCVAQIFFMDYFLEGEFSKYGLEVLRFSELDPDIRTDPMARIFPKLTKCIFHKYGPSGSMQKFDGLCILSLNIVNEKIYIVLWFWFCLLFVASVGQLIYRGATVALTIVRKKILLARYKFSNCTDLDKVTNAFTIGDWFVFNLVCKNVDPHTLQELVHDLARNLNEKLTV